MVQSWRRYVFIVCLGALVCLIGSPDQNRWSFAANDPVASAKQADTVKAHGHPASPAPSEERIQAALEQTTDVEFTDHPLNEVADFLSEVHKIPIVLDTVALSDEGIPTDESISLVVGGIKLHQALDLMLEPLGLTYVVHDGVLKVTSQIVADELVVVRVYDSRDFEAVDISAEDLKRVITACICPKPAAGVAIEPLPGCLVISESLPAHRQIRQLLADLREHASRLQHDSGGFVQ